MANERASDQSLCGAQLSSDRWQIVNIGAKEAPLSAGFGFRTGGDSIIGSAYGI